MTRGRGGARVTLETNTVGDQRTLQNPVMAAMYQVAFPGDLLGIATKCRSRTNVFWSGVRVGGHRCSLGSLKLYHCFTVI